MLAVKLLKGIQQCTTVFSNNVSYHHHFIQIAPLSRRGFTSEAIDMWCRQRTNCLLSATTCLPNWHPVFVYRIDEINPQLSTCTLYIQLMLSQTLPFIWVYGISVVQICHGEFISGNINEYMFPFQQIFKTESMPAVQVFRCENRLLINPV